MKRINIYFYLICCYILSSCASVTLYEPITVINSSIKDYKYIYINPTKEIVVDINNTSSNIYNGTLSKTGNIKTEYSTKSINPKDAIAGILIKEGFIILQEIKPELLNETALVNYAESGRRELGFFNGYTIEISIQFISARTNEIICSATAEGYGSSEIEDIRIAIGRALSSLFSE